MQSSDFQTLESSAADKLDEPRPGPAEAAARIELWRKQEWHGWFRWWLCARGFDWSKPIWIALLTLGFGSLVLYGATTGRWFVTAGGVVAWFTIVNLAFFTYFGLSLPGPPPPIPGPFAPGLLVKATLQLYPAGYNRRKLARMRFRVEAANGEALLIELTEASLSSELRELIKAQERTRIYRSDAPPTEAIIETLSVTREQIDAGEPPVKLSAWKWDAS